MGGQAHAPYVELDALLRAERWDRTEITDCMERLGRAIALDTRTIGRHEARLSEVEQFFARLRVEASRARQRSASPDAEVPAAADIPPSATPNADSPADGGADVLSHSLRMKLSAYQPDAVESE